MRLIRDNEKIKKKKQLKKSKFKTENPTEFTDEEKIKIDPIEIEPGQITKKKKIKKSAKKENDVDTTLLENPTGPPPGTFLDFRQGAKKKQSPNIKNND